MKLHVLEVCETMCHGQKTHIKNYIVEGLRNNYFETIVMGVGGIGLNVRNLVVFVVTSQIQYIF